MARLFTSATLRRENLAFSGTPGISQGNRGSGFRPAFCDTDTGRIEISRFPNGLPAPVHVLGGLPESWIVAQDKAANAIAARCSIVAGFVRDGCFYTREQAAEAVLAE